MIPILVSHRKKFIFIKTEKTAGTSVEAYFEPYCLPSQGERAFSGPRDQYLGETGIIGARGKKARQRRFYSHMPAKAIKDQIGSDLWNSYHKFTIIRNPFDLVVSYFHHLESLFAKNRFPDLPMRRKLHRLIWELQVPKQLDPVARFRRWVHREHWLDAFMGNLYPGFVNNRDKYTIDGAICVDHFIHMENLRQDIKQVCLLLGVPYDPTRLPNLKSGNRPSHLDYEAYYDEATARIVANRYRMEIDRFDYRVPYAL